MYDALEIGLQVFQVAYGKLYAIIYFDVLAKAVLVHTEQYQSPLMDPGRASRRAHNRELECRVWLGRETR
jgi:hypothetical protein